MTTTTNCALQQYTDGLGIEAARCLIDFDEHLTRVRGLAPSTRMIYCFWASRFLAAFCGTAAPDWSSLRGAKLAAFVDKEAARLQRNGRAVPGVALRAFLRYLCFLGEIQDGLQRAIPQKPRWKLVDIPRHLPADDVERVIAGALNGSISGRRNHAILLLLARTGMRAHEVGQLSIDDVNWTDATICVRSKKTRTERRLPLARDVGTALAYYLQHCRPPCTSRIIFLRALPPFKPFIGSSAICRLVRRALTRVGIHKTPAAAHLFRHAAATRMLNSGASFKEIADVLGHASIRSTAVYAKLGVTGLARVAMPWPGSTP